MFVFVCFTCLGASADQFLMYNNAGAPSRVIYDNFIEVYKAAGNSFENPTDEKKRTLYFVMTR